jgi:hypothetical protein
MNFTIMNKIKFQEALQNFVDMFGWKGFIHVLFYPLIVLIATPIRLFKTLWNCRSLAEGKHWKDYPHFSVYSALNSLFYHTRAINLRRHGRAGKSPYLGLGGYKLNRCFHYSLCSLYAYEKAGAVTLILGMFGWWAGHFLWLDADAGRWQLVSMILLLSLCSTTFYVNTFELQNYNVFGWVFFPIGLYGWLTGNWVISSLAWLGASFGSFTVVVIAAILAFVYCLEIGSILPFISVLPAGMSLLSNMWPNFNARGALNTFRGILKAIGLSKANAKYVRTTMMNITIRKVYFLVIYFQFILVLTLIQKQIPVLLSASFIIWIINSKFARFSDEQTMQMLMLTVSTASVLNSTSLTSLY